jgi:hypothetical protein
LDSLLLSHQTSASSESELAETLLCTQAVAKTIPFTQMQREDLIKMLNKLKSLKGKTEQPVAVQCKVIEAPCRQRPHFAKAIKVNQVSLSAQPRKVVAQPMIAPHPPRFLRKDYIVRESIPSYQQLSPTADQLGSWKIIDPE